MACPKRRTFVLHLLDAGGVAAVHGSANGPPGYFRISISTDDRVIKRGCASIGSLSESCLMDRKVARSQLEIQAERTGSVREITSNLIETPRSSDRSSRPRSVAVVQALDQLRRIVMLRRFAFGAMPT